MEFVSRKQLGRAPAYRQPALRIEQRNRRSAPSYAFAMPVEKVTDTPKPVVSIEKKPITAQSLHKAVKPVAHVTTSIDGVIPRKPVSRKIESKTHHATVESKSSEQKAAVHTPSVLSQRVGLKQSNLERAVQPANDRPTQKHAKRSKYSKRTAIAYGFAGLLILSGFAVVAQGFFANQAVETQVKALTNEAASGQSPALPTDKKPKDKNYVANYAVAPLLPRTITIPAANVSQSRVMPMGTDKDGAMEAPKTTYDAGWYTSSARPGEIGAVVIDGHVLGDGSPGIFGKIKNLKAGDAITIERGDHKQLKYQVQKVETVPVNKVDMAKLLVSVDTSKPGLNLITCGGKFDPKTIHFDSRTVVYAVQQ